MLISVPLCSVLYVVARNAVSNEASCRRKSRTEIKIRTQSSRILAVGLSACRKKVTAR